MKEIAGEQIERVSVLCKILRRSACCTPKRKGNKQSEFVKE